MSLKIWKRKRSHSVKQCKQLQQGRADRQLQELGKLLHGDASSSTGAGDGREALQLLPHVVPLQAGGGDERELDGRTDHGGSAASSYLSLRLILVNSTRPASMGSVSSPAEIIRRQSS